MKKIILPALLALIALTSQAQEIIWNDIVMGYANVPIIKVNRVAMYTDRTDVDLQINFRKGQQIGFMPGTALKADGKEYKVTEATVIKLGEPYTMTTEQLVRAARTVKPRVVFPYHYGQTDVSGIPGMLKDDGIDVRIRHYE